MYSIRPTSHSTEGVVQANLILSRCRHVQSVETVHAVRLHHDWVAVWVRDDEINVEITSFDDLQSHVVCAHVVKFHHDLTWYSISKKAPSCM